MDINGMNPDLTHPNDSIIKTYICSCHRIPTLSSYSLSALWRPTNAQWIGHTVLWQLSVTLMAWCHQECWNFLKQILWHGRNKNLFDNINERAWKLPGYLFLIFYRFQVNNDDITIGMRYACERAWSIHSQGSETGTEETLVRPGYFKT